MDNEYVIGPDGELYHWGIKGMRWGQRRYQNKDGSLTPAGRKRYTDADGNLNEKGKQYYAKERARLKAEKEHLNNEKRTSATLARLDKMRKENDALRNEIEGKKTATKVDDSPNDAKRSIPKNTDAMDDKELQAHVNRLNNEKQYKSLSKELGYNQPDKTEMDLKIENLKKQKEYLQLQQDIAKLTPEKISAGKKFVKKMIDEALIPAAVEGGKNFLSKMFNKAGAEAITAAVSAEVDKTAKSVTKSAKKVKASEDAKAAKAEERAAAKEAKREERAEMRAEGIRDRDATAEKVVSYIDKLVSKAKTSKKTTSTSPLSTKEYEDRIDEILEDLDAKAWDAYAYGTSREEKRT